MRTTWLVVLLMALSDLSNPTAAHAQPFALRGSAGPTIIDPGYSFAAGVDAAATSRISVLVEIERTHLSSRLRSDGRGGTAGFRGGTLTLGAVSVAVSALRRDRVGPYGLAGFSAGVSRPNVSDVFPTRVTNRVRTVFFGGGLHVPLKEQLSVFVDGRVMIGEEAGELLGAVPIRAGVVWRF